MSKQKMSSTEEMKLYYNIRLKTTNVGIIAEPSVAQRFIQDRVFALNQVKACVKSGLLEANLLPEIEEALKEATNNSEPKVVHVESINEEVSSVESIGEELSLAEDAEHDVTPETCLSFNLEEASSPASDEDGQEITGEPEKGSEVRWDNQATELLISLHKENEEKFSSTDYTEKKVWAIITEQMKEKGYSFSPTQVENRWKTLIWTSKDTNKNNDMASSNSKILEVSSVSPGSAAGSVYILSTHPSSPLPSSSQKRKERPSRELMRKKIKGNPNFSFQMEKFILNDERSLEEPEVQVGTDANEFNGVRWNREATLLLINFHKQNKEKFESRDFTKKRVWTIITEQLKEKGFLFTPVQVENRWKSLLTSYRSCTDFVDKYGNIRKSCKFFNELHSYLGQKSDKSPIVSWLSSRSESTQPASTSARKTLKEERELFLMTEQLLERKGNDLASKLPLKKKLPGVSSVLDKIDSNVQKRHEERLGMFRESFKELLQTFKHKTPSNQGSSNFVRWNREATLLLISLHQQNQDKFDSVNYTKKKVWGIMTEQMKEKGYTFTSVQIENKWKSLNSAYRNAKEYNRKTGWDPKGCKFFNELDAYLGKKFGDGGSTCELIMHPASVLSGSNEEEASVSFFLAEQLSDTGMTAIEVVKKKQDKTSNVKDVLEKIDANVQRRHEERMDLFRESFKELIETLKSRDSS